MGDDLVKDIKEIRQTLRNIQVYYRSKSLFDDFAKNIGKYAFYDTIALYEKHIENAPKRLKDVYNGLYRQAKAQKVVALEWKVTEKYIQVLNKRLILYFQGVLE